MPITELQMCRPPTEWPTPPQELSVSSLLEIEDCPRRWALRNGSYPGIWADRGYPIAPTPAALAGSAVHLALERIAAELVAAGCESAKGAAAVDVMRRLGGLTAIVERATLDLLSDLQENPRVVPRIAAMKRAVLRRLPHLRERVQLILSRLRFARREALRNPRSDVGGPRRPLPLGSHSEVNLRAVRIGWRGTADLLTVLESGCEIHDYKSGDPSDDHAFQLRVYALLWHRDPELNPAATLATRLLILYADADIDVATLSESELADFERALLDRSRAAREQLALKPPPAKPGPDACSWCAVRHLCADYWRPAAMRAVRPMIEEGDRFEDIEVEIQRPEGPGMWTAAVVSASSLERGRNVKLQTDSERADLFRPGRRLRLLGTRVINLEDFDTEARETLIAPAAWTEYYVCDDGVNKADFAMATCRTGSDI
jgi:hypothetical protein